MTLFDELHGDGDIAFLLTFLGIRYPHVMGRRRPLTLGLLRGFAERLATTTGRPHGQRFELCVPLRRCRHGSRCHPDLGYGHDGHL